MKKINYKKLLSLLVFSVFTGVTQANASCITTFDYEEGIGDFCYTTTCLESNTCGSVEMTCGLGYTYSHSSCPFYIP